VIRLLQRYLKLWRSTLIVKLQNLPRSSRFFSERLCQKGEIPCSMAQCRARIGTNLWAQMLTRKKKAANQAWQTSGL
jgi:hypothetical protein